MSPSRSSRATRSASNGGGSSTTVPAAAALRTSTISPPTCDSGIGTSQRSSGSEPSTAPAARTCAARWPKVSSTGRGVARRAGGVDDQRELVLVGVDDVERRAALVDQRLGDEHLGAARELGALALGEPQVDRHGGRAQEQAAVDGGHERPAGRQRDPDAVAGPRAAQHEPPRRAGRGQQQLVVGQPLVGRLERDAVGTARGGAGEPGTDFHAQAKG